MYCPVFTQLPISLTIPQIAPLHAAQFSRLWLSAQKISDKIDGMLDMIENSM
jgi:hypothetical protein